jgi:hypothetical protein
MVRMKAFFKSLDEKVWNLVEHGWTKLETLFSDWIRDKPLIVIGIIKA